MHFEFCSLSLSLWCTASRLSRLEPFAISHLKLMKEDDTTIEDGTHELFVYKVSFKDTVDGRGPRNSNKWKYILLYLSNFLLRYFKIRSIVNV